VGAHIIERMAVEVEGSGEALILLHGLGGTSNVFTPQMGVLGTRFRVVRFDLPGAGRSPPAPLSMQSLVDAILRALGVLGVEQAHLGGHSMGTIVCQHIAVQQPRAVRRLGKGCASVRPRLAPRAWSTSPMRW